MDKLDTLLRLKDELRRSFNEVRDAPLNMDRLIGHVARLSETVENLIVDNINVNELIRERHLDLLSEPEVQLHDGSVRPAVADIRPWRALPTIIKAGEAIDLSEVPYNKIKFWSDLHFFQENIIKYTNRPFANAAEMNEQLLKNFNAVVDDDDVVIWVGDITFGNVNLTNELLDHCKGYNIQVFGNHDIDRNSKQVKALRFDEVHMNILLDDIVITHHPWKERLPQHLWNVHGHIHNHTLGMPRHINVSCEVLNYRPVSLHELLVRNGYWDQR